MEEWKRVFLPLEEPNVDDAVSDGDKRNPEWDDE
jgi:hypothetical protein